jgi:LysR family transcriptional regulator, glycine cleavage system transcriptional activator
VKPLVIAFEDKPRRAARSDNNAETRGSSSAKSLQDARGAVALSSVGPRAASAGAMKLRDVPLAFLPTFEAAGRLGSFAAAAAELCLTPSAVSQQIRGLEDALGVPLFERTGRTAALTLEGERYLKEVRTSLQELATATSRLRRRNREAVLRMSTISMAAHEFLMPRLAAFHNRFPGIELCIETSNEVIDFKVSDYDAALRVGEGWPELRVHALGRASAAVVCAPQLARAINSPLDLCNHTLLDPSGIGERALQALFAAHGRPELRTVRTWHFETCYDTLRAAEHGLGVAFGVFPAATPLVQSGKLAVPLAERIPIPGQVCFVHRPDDERFPFTEIAAWMAAEYSALPALPEGRIS